MSRRGRGTTKIARHTTVGRIVEIMRLVIVGSLSGRSIEVRSLAKMDSREVVGLTSVRPRDTPNVRTLVSKPSNQGRKPARCGQVVSSVGW
jgi:hypothetical protein